MVTIKTINFVLIIWASMSAGALLGFALIGVLAGGAKNDPNN